MVKNKLEQALRKLGGFNEKQISRISERLSETLDYVPKVGVFGKTGAGKSSLCNTLFGQDVCPVSDIEACTRKTQEVLLEMGQDKGLVLMDVPGVGENNERDEEYAGLYSKLLPELDLVLWVLKADDRAYAVDIDFFERVVKPCMKKDLPFLIVLNQIDKVEPFREWDEAACHPGPKQAENIRLKLADVASCFGFPPSRISAVSAIEGYGLTDLVDTLVFALPDKQRVGFGRELDEKLVSSKAQSEIRESLSRETKRVLTGVGVGGIIGGLVGGPVGGAIGATIGGFIGKLFG